MPIINSKDNKGYFYQFGLTGKKYYYSPVNKESQIKAYNKCLKQSRAIEYSKHHFS